MSSNVINFVINVNGNSIPVMAELNDAVGRVKQNIEAATPKFEKIGKIALSFESITNVVEKAAGAFDVLVGTSLDFEQQQANLQTLLNGDAQATERLLTQIREYGKATVYDRSGLVEAQKTMMAFGLEAEYAFGKLKNIGDIALGDSEKMKSLALAFSQMSSTGKLMGQDLLQMINAGFNPLEVISQRTGKSIATLKDEMSKGAISAELVAQAFEWATEEGGRFYQGAESAAQTTAGKIAKMQDTIDEWKVGLFEATGGATAYIAELGKMVIPFSQLLPLFSSIYSGVRKFISLDFSGVLGRIKHKATEARISLAFMRNDIVKCNMASLGFVQNTVRATLAVGRFATVGLFNAVKGVGAYVASLVTGGAVSKAFAATSATSFGVFAATAKAACRAVSVAIMSIPIVGWIAAGIAAVIALISALWNRCEGFRRLVMGAIGAIQAVLQNLWTGIKNGVDLVWNSVLKPFIDRTVERFVNAFQAIRLAVVSVADFFVNIWNWISETIGKIYNWIVTKLGPVAGWIKSHLVDPVKNAFSNLWDVIRGVFDKMLDKLGKLFQPIRELWNKLFPKDKMVDVRVAYQQGAEKGSESFRKSQKEKNGEVDVEQNTSVLGGVDVPTASVFTANAASGATADGSMGKSAGVSAGKAQQITIKVENMVGSMSFNGGLSEKKEEIESVLTEMLARILGMAETATV